MMYQYTDEVLKNAEEALGRPLTNNELHELRAMAVAYFSIKGKEFAKKVMGGTPIGDHNIKVIFGDD